MEDFLRLVVSATASGCIYALVALAYLLITRPTGIINFAVGEWAMVAAFGAHLALSRAEWPYPVGVALVVLAMLVVGWLTERLTVRPLVERGAPALAPGDSHDAGGGRCLGPAAGRGRVPCRDQKEAEDPPATDR